MVGPQVQNVVLQNFILNTVSDWFNDKELTEVWNQNNYL
jgi:hypothetical protein